MIMTNPLIPNREVYCRDAVEYLRHCPDYSLPSVITSLPDAEEIGQSFKNWERWFVDSCELIFSKVRLDQFVFFYQTDRKTDGGIIDKSFLVNAAARESGISQIFHKIVLRKNVGVIDLFRPGYTHLLCFSNRLKGGKATPDVMFAGDMLYKNAMGMNAAKVCLDLIDLKAKCDTIFDPFCGMGSVLKMANQYGKKSIGIDILYDQCCHALDLPITDFKLD